jgi:hypothetical protein
LIDYPKETVKLSGSGYILTDNAPNGILSPKLAQEERHYDPERYHA